MSCFPYACCFHSRPSMVEELGWKKKETLVIAESEPGTFNNQSLFRKWLIIWRNCVLFFCKYFRVHGGNNKCQAKDQRDKECEKRCQGNNRPSSPCLGPKEAKQDHMVFHIHKGVKAVFILQEKELAAATWSGSYHLGLESLPAWVRVFLCLTNRATDLVRYTGQCWGSLTVFQNNLRTLSQSWCPSHTLGKLLFMAINGLFFGINKQLV